VSVEGEAELGEGGGSVGNGKVAKRRKARKKVREKRNSMTRSRSFWSRRGKLDPVGGGESDN